MLYENNCLQAGNIDNNYGLKKSDKYAFVIS